MRPDYRRRVYLPECGLWAIAKAKASVRSISASYAGFLYTQSKIAHSQSGKSSAIL